jgi:hypothetical protein
VLNFFCPNGPQISRQNENSGGIEWLCKRLAKEFFWFHKTNRLVIASFDVFFSCEKNKVLTQASFASQDLITQNDL